MESGQDSGTTTTGAILPLEIRGLCAPAYIHASPDSMRAGARNVGTGRATVKRVCSESLRARFNPSTRVKGNSMNGIVYLVGAIVIVLFVLSFLGLR